MANTIRHKRGTTVPLAGNLQTGEIAINTTNGFVYTKTDAGGVVQVNSDLSGYAPIASPALTGVPTAPTPLATDNSTTIATTAYVTSAVASATTSPSTDKVVKICKNATGSLIPARSVVYINGANGTHPTIQLAQANAESTSYRTFGITSANIANSADGTVVIIGEILNVNTGSFVEGDQLFLSPTVAGGITNVKPSAPDHMVYVGVCTRANANNGSIEVKVVNGFELNELHDVAIATKVDNQLVAYESSTNLWKNKSAATLGIAELSGATFNGKVNLTSVGGLAGLNIGIGGTSTSAVTAGDLWIATGGTNLNFRDGTGAWRILATQGQTNVFSTNQIISGSSTSAMLRVTQTGTGSSIVVEDSTNPDATSFVVDSSGNVGIGVPSGYTATNKLEVVGAVKATSITFDGTKQFSVNNSQTNPFGSGNMYHSEYPLEMLVSYNGSTYAMPMRLVSTP